MAGFGTAVIVTAVVALVGQQSVCVQSRGSLGVRELLLDAFGRK